MKGRRSIAGRDQTASAFAAALLRLCDSCSATGAALVDAEGETVDYAGAISPFDIKVAAAEWVIILSLLRHANASTLRETEVTAIRGSKKSFLIQSLTEGYALVLQLIPHAFGASRRGVEEAIRELCAEAGLELPVALRRQKERWSRVDVRSDATQPKRPSSIWLAGAWAPLEIIGRWATNGASEAGYRARLQSGAELTLVREPLGHWFSDAPLP